MKTSYKVRAERFLKDVFGWIEDCLNDPCAIDSRISYYNMSEHHRVVVKWGCARCALINSDYVIKFEYDLSNAEDVGGCEDEMKFYQFARKNHFEYLFAEITHVSYNGYDFYIMPRVKNVGDKSKYRVARYHLNDDEFDFLDAYVADLHCFNMGYAESGKPIVIDYAFNRLRE